MIKAAQSFAFSGTALSHSLKKAATLAQTLLAVEMRFVVHRIKIGEKRSETCDGPQKPHGNHIILSGFIAASAVSI
jgi:hypothetical protein